MRTLKGLLEQATAQLALLSKTPRLDVELLLAYVLKKDRVYLFSHPEYELSFQEHQQWQSLLGQRCLQVPVAYLLGQKYFWDLDLQVNEHTLIPRSETELLVELVLCRGDRLIAQSHDVNVLDLGTGSGAIALALARERPDWKISAVDFSKEALKIARINSVKNNIRNVEFFQSDWFSVFSAFRRPAASTSGSSNVFKWDIIVSNPPYLDENDTHLVTEEIRHEPRAALVAKKNGLADFEKIIADARHYLKPGGQVLLEHGCLQGEAVRELFLRHGYESIGTSRDLAGLERVTFGMIQCLQIGKAIL